MDEGTLQKDIRMSIARLLDQLDNFPGKPTPEGQEIAAVDFKIIISDKDTQVTSGVQYRNKKYDIEYEI